MTTYLAPTREMQFVLNELAGLDAVNQLPGYDEATPDLVQAILEEAGRFAAERLAPLNKSGDTEGSRLVDGKVVVPTGFTEAYQEFVEGGWVGLSMNPEYEGQGLPELLSTAVAEMWNSANLAFTLCSLLTTGAIHALETHARDILKPNLPREDGERRVVRHHEPHGTTGGIGFVRSAHEGGSER